MEAVKRWSEGAGEQACARIGAQHGCPLRSRRACHRRDRVGTAATEQGGGAEARRGRSAIMAHPCFTQRTALQHHVIVSEYERSC